jgi:excisionase family DNA binding protein
MRFVHGERLINAHWASKRLGLAARTIRKLAGTGCLPAVRVGPKIWMFRPSDVETFKRGNAALIRPRRRVSDRELGQQKIAGADQ